MNFNNENEGHFLNQKETLSTKNGFNFAAKLVGETTTPEEKVEHIQNMDTQHIYITNKKMIYEVRDLINSTWNLMVCFVESNWVFLVNHKTKGHVIFLNKIVNFARISKS